MKIFNTSNLPPPPFILKRCCNSNLAFTLAEILITLGIIGVLAAITIPNIIQNSQERATVTALKKAYSIISNAYTLAVQENGTPENWEFITGNSAYNNKLVIDKFVPYLNILKYCGNNTGCFPDVIYKYKNSNDFLNLDAIAGGKVQLTDGTLLYFGSVKIGCSTPADGSTIQLQNQCASAIVDINGFKSPNQLGRDLFYFSVTKYGIIPKGSSGDISESFSNNCLPNTAASTGIACTAWVIYNENMDYFHCSDLSWTGKTKCN